MERLAALEAEVKADADAQRARKEAALSRAREQRAAQEAERDELRARQAAIVARKRAPARDDDGDLEELDGRDRGRGRAGARGSARGVDELGDALALARKAHDVKQELARPPKAGEKSWIKSGIASMALGPIGWLYAGSLREAVPASAAWVGIALLASKILPVFLLMPALMVALPLSAIAGVVYALQYNRTGKRQRLFGEDKPKKQLPSGG